MNPSLLRDLPIMAAIFPAPVSPGTENRSADAQSPLPIDSFLGTPRVERTVGAILPHLQNGDLVFAATVGSATSDAFNFFANLTYDTYDPYLHAGIIVFEGERPYVYEAYYCYEPLARGKTLQHKIKGGVYRTPLEKFIARYSSLQVIRLPSAQANQSLAAHAHNTLKRRPKFTFDPYFNLDTPAVYCTEYVYRLLKEIQYPCQPVLVPRNTNPEVNEVLQENGVTSNHFVTTHSFRAIPGSRVVLNASLNPSATMDTWVIAAYGLLHEKVRTGLPMNRILIFDKKLVARLHPDTDTFISRVMGYAANLDETKRLASREEMEAFLDLAYTIIFDSKNQVAEHLATARYRDARHPSTLLDDSTRVAVAEPKPVREITPEPPPERLAVTQGNVATLDPVEQVTAAPQKEEPRIAWADIPIAPPEEIQPARPKVEWRKVPQRATPPLTQVEQVTAAPPKEEPRIAWADLPISPPEETVTARPKVEWKKMAPVETALPKRIERHAGVANITPPSLPPFPLPTKANALEEKVSQTLTGARKSPRPEIMVTLPPDYLSRLPDARSSAAEYWNGQKIPRPLDPREHALMERALAANILGQRQKA